MGLLGCPASFQRLMEGVLRNLQNVIVYIDNLLIYSDTHELQLQILEQVLERRQQNHLKINLEKCIFDNKEVDPP
jgi:Reverse transcriptase (RNA-dependent DNA polymerase)